MWFPSFHGLLKKILFIKKKKYIFFLALTLLLKPMCEKVMRPFLQRCQVGWFPMMLKRNFCEVVLEKKKYSGQCETVQCESFSFKKGLASGRPDVSSYWKKWSVSLSTPYIVSLRHGIICVAGQVGNDVFVGI